MVTYLQKKRCFLRFLQHNLSTVFIYGFLSKKPANGAYVFPESRAKNDFPPSYVEKTLKHNYYGLESTWLRILLYWNCLLIKETSTERQELSSNRLFATSSAARSFLLSINKKIF